jgi:hypothetical protein
VAVHFLGALALCIGWTLASGALWRSLGKRPAQMPLREEVANWLLASLSWSLFMYFTVAGCMYAFIYFNEAREREGQAARLSAQLADARLGALRMQLHPHFLFYGQRGFTPK